MTKTSTVSSRRSGANRTRFKGVACWRAGSVSSLCQKCVTMRSDFFQEDIEYTNMFEGPRFESFDRVWLLTWTAYATWLPGDSRGFVSPKHDDTVTQKRNNQIGTIVDSDRPDLQRWAKAKVVGKPVLLTKQHAAVLKRQFEETAQFRDWTVIVGAIMPNHVHLLVGASGDPDPSSLLRDFKSYASRSLNKEFTSSESGTWWTEQGSKRKVYDETFFANARRYVLEQSNSFLIWGVDGTGG